MNDHAVVSTEGSILLQCGLRGGSEHRDSKLSQLGRERDTQTEDSSKNRTGELAQLKLEIKSFTSQRFLKQASAATAPYWTSTFSKLPKEAIEEDLFYLPLDKVSNDLPTWYVAPPIGKTNCTRWCAHGGVETRTNHILRATGATDLYDDGVPEKLINERASHCSLDTIRMYEQTGDKQHHAISRILSSSRKQILK